MDPYKLRLREKERQLARLQRDQERSVLEKHEEALAAASLHGIPTSLFPLEAPLSLFPWFDSLGPRADCEESLRLAIGLRDLEQLGKYLAIGTERGLDKTNSRIFFEANELKDLLEAEGPANAHPYPYGVQTSRTRHP